MGVSIEIVAGVCSAVGACKEKKIREINVPVGVEIRDFGKGVFGPVR